MRHRQEGRGPAAPDGGVEGGHRDGPRLLPGMRARRLGDPVLVVSDGAAGVVRASEEAFPRSARQRCLAHRMRNLAARCRPTDGRSSRRGRRPATRRGPAPSPGTRPPASLPSTNPTADGCPLLPGRLRACVARLRLPMIHRRATRTNNLLKRLFVEERRRLKIIPNGFSEKAVLRLMFGTLIRAAKRWRGLRFSESETHRLTAVRTELDKEYTTSMQSSATGVPTQLVQQFSALTSGIGSALHRYVKSGRDRAHTPDRHPRAASRAFRSNGSGRGRSPGPIRAKLRQVEGATSCRNAVGCGAARWLD